MPINPLQSDRAPIDDVWTPTQVHMLDALVGACALVAHADGWVTPEERKRVLERMRALPALQVFGVAEASVCFEALEDRFDRNPEAARAEARKAVRRLRGQGEAARLVVSSACAVADADGGFDGEERQVLLRICHLLALDPSQFVLVHRGAA